MFSWWILIPLVAIVGGLIVEYQKNKMKMMQQSQRNQNDVEDLQLQLDAMRKRIENLEAIAATEPEEFNGTVKGDNSEIELENDLDKTAAENKKQVADIAKKRRVH